MKKRQNRTGIVCLECGAMTTVLDSRPIIDPGTIYRRRQCDECAVRGTTHEIWDKDLEKLHTELKYFRKLFADLVEIKAALKGFPK